MSSKYTFEQYRVIFEGAVSKYEGEPFFADLIAKRGRPAFPDRPQACAVVGVRREGKKVQGHENTADDIIALVRFDRDNNPQVLEYVGTTESGFWKFGDPNRRHHPEGDFKMSPGFYWYKHGLHHGKDPCLVPDCLVIGERFQVAQGAYIYDDGKLWKVTDGTIHIHAGIGNVNNVGNWSAGCTVVAGGWEGKAWKEFYKYCKLATNVPIPYVLVNESDIPDLLARGGRVADARGANGAAGAAVEEAPPTLPAFEPFEPSLPVDESPVVGASLSAARFDKTRFWGMYREGLRRLAEKVYDEEVPHVENILDRAGADPRVRDLGQLAYMLATARWETNRFRNLYEKGDDKYLSQYQGRGGNTKPGDYKRYRGTGYVHLTFRDNFRKAGEKIGQPLEETPSLAADPHWAYEIMVRGSLEGWFTGRKLGAYVGDGKTDFRNARNVINPGELTIADKARKLAPGARTPRQQQCVEALDTQVKWAGLFDECLRASEIQDRVVFAPPPPEGEDDDPAPMFGGVVVEESAVVESSASPDEGPEEPETEGAGGTLTTVSTQSVQQTEPKKEESMLDKPREIVQASIGSVKRMNATILGGVVAGIAAVRSFIDEQPVISAIIFLVAIVAIIWLVSWYIHIQRDLDKKRMEIAADPNKNAVK